MGNCKNKTESTAIDVQRETERGREIERKREVINQTHEYDEYGLFIRSIACAFGCFDSLRRLCLCECVLC